MKFYRIDFEASTRIRGKLKREDFRVLTVSTRDDQFKIVPLKE